MHLVSVLFTGALILLFPVAARAQQYTADTDTLQGFILLIGGFIGNTLIPFLFAVALLFFLVNAARYFILDGDDSDGQEKAKTLALYGIGAFVFLVSIWGIVNLFVEGFEIDDTAARCPDYLGRWCSTKDAYSGQFNNYQFSNDNLESYYGDLGSQQGAQRQTFEVYDADGNRVAETQITPTTYDADGTRVNEPYADELENPNANIRKVEEGSESTQSETERNIYRVLTEEDVVNIGEETNELYEE
jgi:hypothetical protein